MEFLTEKRFSFVSAGAQDDAFGVVYFSGREALSFLYEFDITLVAKDAAIDLGAVLQQPATFTIHRPQDEEVEFNGILAHFEQLHEFNGFVFYRAQLRPRLWWLTLTRHNQVCLNLPVVPSTRVQQPSLIGQVLKDGGLTTLDYAFRTEKTYAPHEYVCQYGETHYNFVARWLEREGIYYFFEQTEMGERLVMTDSMLSHRDLPQEGTLIYAPPSGLDAQHRDEVIKVLTCRQKMLPRKVLLRDHNYARPSLDMAGSAGVDPQGRGEAYIYGESFTSPEEGDRLAKLRAEELLCRKVEFFGESTVPFMMPGYTFSLQNHYRADFNQRYLVTEVQHQGNQTGYLISGLQGGLTGQENAVSYRNSFTAIPAATQFRPERLAQKPRISGTLHATIDAEGSGEYAELDDQGRYKVRLPFDINSEHKAGKASCFLRMAQPYAGPKRGMHFPLPKGTEVLLTFIDGDPDRPVIASAVPNPETPSPSTEHNQTESVIQTGSNNRMRFEDKKGSERIIMQSPTSNTWMRIGAPNDPEDPFTRFEGDNLVTYEDGEGTWHLYEDGKEVTSERLAVPQNNNQTLTYRLNNTLQVINLSGQYKKVGSLTEHEPLSESPPTSGSEHTINSSTHKLLTGVTIPNGQVQLVSGFETDDGTSYSFYIANKGGTYLRVSFEEGLDLSGTPPAAGSSQSVEGKTWILSSSAVIPAGQIIQTVPCYREVQVRLYTIDSEVIGGVRIRSDDDFITEAGKVYGEYFVGKPPNPEPKPDIKTIMDKFSNTGDYSPEGFYSVSGKELGDSVETVLDKAHISIKKVDTFTTQEGCIYDFGGYWNYNLGNSYEEKHTNQKAKLNASHSIKWPKANASIATSIIKGVLGAALIGVTISNIAKVAASAKGNVRKTGFIAGISGVVVMGVSRLIQHLSTPSVKDFLNGGSEKFGEKDGMITGHRVELKTRKTWASKAFVPKNADDKNDNDAESTLDNVYKGGEYNYQEMDSIDIRVGDKEEHFRGNSSAWTYGGTHEDLSFNGQGVLTHYEAKGLAGKTVVFNKVEIDFDDVTSAPKQIQTAGIINLDLKLPSVPKIAFDIDGSMGNLTMSAAAGGNMTLDLGGGDNLVIKAKGWNPSDWEIISETEASNGKIVAATKTMFQNIDARISANGVELAKLDIPGLEAKINGKMVEISDELKGTQQRIRTVAAEIVSQTSAAIESVNMRIDNAKIVKISTFGGFKLEA